MNITLLIKKYFPFSFIYPIAAMKERNRKTKKMMYSKYLSNLECSEDPELIEYAGEMRKMGFLTDFNGDWTKKYSYSMTKVHKDGDFCFVKYPGLCGERDLYYPGNPFSAYLWNYSIRLQEDDDSPHRYFSDCIKNEFLNNPTSGSILDLGAAEGFFSLNVIDYVEKAYLFEADPKWNGAINKTFQTDAGKIIIVNKFVSDHTSDQYVSVDDYFGDVIPNDIRVIKIDIEGFEQRALIGMKKTLSKNPKAILLICAYHQIEAEMEIREILEPMGYDVESRSGLMLFVQDPNDRYPFVRHGVLEAKKV